MKLPKEFPSLTKGLMIGGIAELISGPGDNFSEKYFTPHIFFVIILPPIVFDAGFFMPKTPFFDNIGTILTYAIVGTLFNAMAIGFSLYGVFKAGLIPGWEEDLELVHCLLFGSIISAVDPVAVIAVFDEIQVMVFYSSDVINFCTVKFKVPTGKFHHKNRPKSI